MRVLAAAAVIALLTTPALMRPVYAQAPQINLMPELPTKTQEEKDADEVRDKAYRDLLGKSGREDVDGSMGKCAQRSAQGVRHHGAQDARQAKDENRHQPELIRRPPEPALPAC